MAKKPADENQFDERRETLVMETKTTWAAGADVGASEKGRIAQALHQQPKDAKKLEYVRSPSGFVRHITVTDDDLARLKKG